MGSGSPFDFLLGAITGAILMAVGLANCGSVSPKQVDACARVCAPNGGTSEVFLDGECRCLNGAKFNNNKPDPTP